MSQPAPVVQLPPLPPFPTTDGVLAMLEHALATHQPGEGWFNLDTLLAHLSGDFHPADGLHAAPPGPRYTRDDVIAALIDALRAARANQ